MGSETMATGFLATLALGILILMITALCVFSFIWVMNGGESAGLKPASWISRSLFWFGVFVMGVLMLMIGVGAPLTIAWLAWRL